MIIGWFGAQVIEHYSQQPGSPELKMGQRIMYQMMGQKTLRKAGFYQGYPEAKPTQFVDFVNSSSGQILWPPSKSPSEKHGLDLPGASNRSNRLLRPQGLYFSAREPASDEGKQIVYVPDDAHHKMIIKGYESPDAPPVFTYEFDFPTDAGAIPL